MLFRSDPDALSETPPAPYLRRAFDLSHKSSKAVSARLYVTARGIFRAYLNGERVGEDDLAPGWTDYDKRIYYQTYDVTGLLREGENALGAMLSDGWYCGHIGLTGRQNYGKAAEFLAQLEVNFEDGSQQIITSDAEWLLAYGAIQSSDLLMGETYDAREDLKLEGWLLPGYVADPERWKTPPTVKPMDSVLLQAYPTTGVRRVMEQIGRAHV